MDKGKWTHFDDSGNAIMVDVTDKASTRREAVAVGYIRMEPSVLEQICSKGIKKGDVLGVARVAGIMGVKKCSDLIPMCHPLFISKCKIDFEIDKEESRIKAECSVLMEGKTGVEMEALSGVSITLLTIYDMCKALDKRMVIENIHLQTKTGGKSGDFTF